MATDEPGSERDHIELKERFDQLRPEILETLRMFSFFLIPHPHFPNCPMNLQVSLLISQTLLRSPHPTPTSVLSLRCYTKTPFIRPLAIHMRIRLKSMLTALGGCLRGRLCGGVWCMGKRGWCLQWRKVGGVSGGSIWMSTGRRRRDREGNVMQWRG